MKHIVHKNGYIKKFGDDFVEKFAKLALHRLKHLKNSCENQVEAQQEERLMDFKILQLPSKTGEIVHVHVYNVKVWVDCESTSSFGGLVYDYTKYSYKTRVSLVDKMSQAAKDKGVEALKCFLKKVVGPEPQSSTTTTQRPTTTRAATTNQPHSTVNINLVGDCEAENE